MYYSCLPQFNSFFMSVTLIIFFFLFCWFLSNVLPPFFPSLFLLTTFFGIYSLFTCFCNNKDPFGSKPFSLKSYPWCITFIGFDVSNCKCNLFTLCFNNVVCLCLCICAMFVNATSNQIKSQIESNQIK